MRREGKGRAERRAGRLPRTIWYMGAKSRVLPGFLDRVLCDEIPRGGTVVDLMSGTGVVSAWCAGRWRVVANDAQSYAAVIARSLIEHDPATRDAFLASLDLEADLGETYRDHRARLRRRYSAALREEARWLERLSSVTTSRPSRLDREAIEGYRRFLSLAGSSFPGSDGRPPAPVYRDAAPLVSEASARRRRRDPFRRPACLVAAYYAGVYYGLRQAIELDALRAAAEAIGPADPFGDQKRVHYTSALLHAASVTTSGTSHFAQPRHLRKDSEVLAVARRRRIDVFESMRTWEREIAATVASTAYRKGNRVHCGDWRDLVRDGALRVEGGTDLVYLDPPYTADNYSRFYHVLEVLARYDWPELKRDGSGAVLRGRYPVSDERFQSGFCRRPEVEEEFRQVIDASAAGGAKLVISYSSPTGLLLRRYALDGDSRPPLERFGDLCREFYRRVSVETRAMLHSGQGDKNRRVEELLVVAKEPR